MYKLSKADREFIEEHRGRYLPEARWYAAMTHWGRERAVLEKVEKEFGDSGLEELLLPELKGEDEPAGKKTGKKLLFGGHLFFRCRMSDEIYTGVCAHPWVFKIFSKAYRIPDVIDDEEMRIFKGALETIPVPRLVTRSQIGANATVIDGLMKGLQGRVVEVSAHLVKIETQFSFLDHGNSIVISVPHLQVLIEESSGGQAQATMNNKAVLN